MDASGVDGWLLRGVLGNLRRRDGSKKRDGSVKFPPAEPWDMPEEVPGRSGVYAVDTELFDTPGFMSAYVVDAERPAAVDPRPATGGKRLCARRPQ